VEGVTAIARKSGFGAIEPPEQDDRQVDPPSPSDEIAEAKQLPGSSVISDEKFAQLKARALRAEQREPHTV
jgi:hypothetical protein